MPTNTPHYSRVTEDIDTINPISGRSIYFAVRPWRCTDRMTDFFTTFFRLEGFAVTKKTGDLFWKCAWSELGEEPQDNYNALTPREVMFYVDRMQSGMLREKAWGRYPYSVREVSRVLADDSVKLRVWRKQRELELGAKEGKVEDTITENIFSNAPSAMDEMEREMRRRGGK